MRRGILWAPLVVFALLFALVAVGLLRPANRPATSRLLGKSLPVLDLPAIVPGHPGFTAAGSGPRLVNVFASWCVPCAAEVGQLERLRRSGVAVDGIAVRDTPGDLAAFLAAHGDPYRTIGNDPDSGSMIALGSGGVPESFVVDARGMIRHHHVGAIGPQHFAEVLRAYQAAR